MRYGRPNFTRGRRGDDPDERSPRAGLTPDTEPGAIRLQVRTDGLRRSGRDEYHERGDDYQGHEER
jgi:hypothetical protein